METGQIRGWRSSPEKGLRALSLKHSLAGTLAFHLLCFRVSAPVGRSVAAEDLFLFGIGDNAELIGGIREKSLSLFRSRRVRGGLFGRVPLFVKSKSVSFLSRTLSGVFGWEMIRRSSSEKGLRALSLKLSPAGTLAFHLLCFRVSAPVGRSVPVFF